MVDDVARQLEQWRHTPTIGVAADLLNHAHIAQLRPMLTEPARFIVNQETALPKPLLMFANKILGENPNGEASRTGLGFQYEIAKLKRHLRTNPRDAIALIDLARLYATQGQNTQAKKAIISAAALQPNHRFIIRSASRFFVHNDDPEQALHLLTRSGRLDTDPWVLASAIAVETVLGRSPRFMKRARALLDDSRFAPRDLTELGAALSTIHINDGEMKQAKRLLNTALNDPNDNVVAQAVWAASEFRMPINIRPEWLTDKFSSEACFYAAEEEGNFERAMEAAGMWFEDEPFSTRPLRGAAFVASVVGKYQDAESYMREALRLDPTSNECKNNLVFALASQSQINESIKLINDVIQSEFQKDSGEVSGHTLANVGMLYYRTGEIELGRKYYQRACEVYTRSNNYDSKVLAAVFWVQEAMLARDPEVAIAESVAKQALENSPSPAGKFVLDRVKGVAAAPASIEKEKARGLIRSATIWTHDREKNVLLIEHKDPFRGSQK